MQKFKVVLLTPKPGEKTEWDTLTHFVQESIYPETRPVKILCEIGRRFMAHVEGNDGWYFPNSQGILHKWWGRKFEIIYYPKTTTVHKPKPIKFEKEVTQMLTDEDFELLHSISESLGEIMRQSITAIIKGETEYFYTDDEMNIIRREFGDDINVSEIKNDFDKTYCWEVSLKKTRYT